MFPLLRVKQRVSIHHYYTWIYYYQLLPISVSRTCRWTRTRPGLHSFARALLWYTFLFQLVYHGSAAWFYVIFLACFTSQLCHRRFIKPVAGPFVFQPCAGYSSAPLARPLSGAAGLTEDSALLFHPLSRT